MIPKEIKKEHIVKAIEDIKNGDIPNKRQSTKHDIIYEGSSYPPKFVLSIACKYAIGHELDSNEFSGGSESNQFLESLGFKIKSKRDWTERECYFAVWGYDQIDMDRTLVKSELYKDLAEITGRTTKAVEYKLQNVSSCDPRPWKDKPISEAANAQKLLKHIYIWYWEDKESARKLYDSYIEEVTFNKTSTTEVTTQTPSKERKTIIIEEGAEETISIKSKKRSTKLIKEGRKYFQCEQPDNKLRCLACGYTKPENIDREIVQLHHTEMISEINATGKKIDMKDAIKSLIPLCPTCHQIAHSSKPPLSLVSIKSVIS